MTTPDDVLVQKNLTASIQGYSPCDEHNYIEQLQSELKEEREQKEALSLERAKLKVCWEMTLEELANTRAELLDKISHLENKIRRQVLWKKKLRKLLMDYGNNWQEIKGVIENILIERPKFNVK